MMNVTFFGRMLHFRWQMLRFLGGLSLHLNHLIA